MARDDDPIRDGIKTSIPLMLRGIAKKNAHGGSRRELMGGSGGKIGIALAPKHPEMCIGGMTTIESEIWGMEVEGFGRVAIDEIGGGVESLNPKRGRKTRLKKKRTHHVIHGAKHAFGLAVLRRSVRARHAHSDPIREKKGASGGVIELTSIVALYRTNGGGKLCFHIGKKTGQGGKSI